MLAPLVLLALALQGEETPALVPGRVTKSEISAGSPDVDAPDLTRRLGDQQLRGEAFVFDAPEGLWTVEVSSLFFDAYLVVRTHDGSLVTEDDNGLGKTDARVVLLAPEGGQRFEVWVCAKGLRHGKFELRAVEGDAPIPEARKTTPRDLRLEAQAIFDEYGLGTEDAIYQIRRRSFELNTQRRYAETLLMLEPALALLEGPEHELARAYVHVLCMEALGKTGRAREACEHGLVGTPVILSLPEKYDHGAYAYNLAFYMWRDGRYREGYDWMQRGWEKSKRLLPEDANELDVMHPLWLSYQRANGEWDEYLATLDEPVVLGAGDSIEGVAVLNTVMQVTDILQRDYSVTSRIVAPTLFRVEESGVYTLEMRSFAFDAYLVLRDDAGVLIAEDDDARGLRDARMVVTLDADRVYLLEPTALHGGFGPFQVDLIAGRPEERTPWERRQSDLAEAEACERFVDENPERYVVNALDMASTLYHNLGRWEDKLRVNERAVEARRKLGGVGSATESLGLIWLAQALRQAGRTAEALPMLEEVRERQVRERGAGNETPLLLGELARAHRARGDAEAASELYAILRERTRRALGEDSPEYLDHLWTQAREFQSQGRYEEAIEIGERLVDYYDGLEARESSGMAYLTAGAHRDLGNWLTWVLRFEEALVHLEEALRLDIMTFGELSERAAYSRMLVGWTLAYVGDHDRAHEEWQRSREVYERLGSSGLTLCLANGADIHACRGEMETAFELIREAVDRPIRGKARFLSTLPEALRLRQLRTSGWYLGILLGIGERVDGSESDTYERLLTYKELVGRSLIQSRASARASLDPREVELVEELQDVQSELAKAFHEQQPPEFLKRLREQRVRVEDELARIGGGGDEVRLVTVEELAQALPENAVLVDLDVSVHYEPPTYVDGETQAPTWWRSREVSAWILRRGAEGVVRVDLGPASELEGPAKDLGGALLAARGVQPTNRRSDSENRDELRRRLWDPIAAHVGDAELVFVSTSDFLGAIPFEVLQREDGSFLIEHHSFVYLSDAANLVDAGERAEPGEATLLLVGDVDYEARDDDAGTAEHLAAVMPGELRGAASTTWTPLPFTANEVERIDDLFERRSPEGKATRLTGSAATERALKESLPGHSWIHVATHGFFRPEGTTSMWGEIRGVGEDVSGFFPGLLSGLVLAGANREPEEGRDDGLLTAEELTWLDLSRCELVTLSACETGLGSARGGEGLIGLRRAFHQAGARTVVASLWAVEDEATARLMESFYLYKWVEGLPRAEALRRARLDLLRANREAGDPRPSTWGAFVLSGEWR